MPGHDIIVVGASAGGVEALIKLTGSLPPDLPAAVFIVLHLPPQSSSVLPDILNRAGSLPVIHPTDGTEIEHGHIYVAPPDHHMLVERGKVRLVRGPKENLHRPAVDPLFRSAAQAYGPRVVGVILTGALDDGTAGLLAVKRRGGITVVQNPDDALYPSMPLSALQNVEVDYTSPLSGIGPLLERLASSETKDEEDYPVPEDMKKETRIAQMDTAMMHNHEPLGTPSAFSCPACGGVLWELHDGELLRFRCRVGHAFSIESVLAEQSQALETALWVALKTLEESTDLSRRLAQQAYKRGQNRLARYFEERSQDAEQRAQLIRQALIKSDPLVETEAIMDSASAKIQE